MNRFTTILLLIVVAGLGMVTARSVPAVDRARAQPAPPAAVFTTTLSTDKTVAPPGDRVAVTANIIADVPILPVDADIALVLDASGSMTGDPDRAMKAAAREMVTVLDLPAHPSTRVAVIEFNQLSSTICPFSNDPIATIACIDSIRIGGGTAIDRGLQQAAAELAIGAATRAPGSREIVVLLSDGENNGGCPPVIARADRLKAAGVRIFTICLGTGCDSACMRRVASSARDYYEARDFRGLLAVFSDMGMTIRAMPAIRSVDVEVRLPTHLTVDPETVVPSKGVVIEEQRVVWEMNRFDRDGVMMSFEADVLESGFAPIMLDAEIGMIDDSIYRESAISEPVGDPAAAPTPTATTTHTPEPTQTPLPTATLQVAEWFTVFLPSADASR